MATKIFIKPFNGDGYIYSHDPEELQGRDCWTCVHIEESMGAVCPQVCLECKWAVYGATKDNYVERPQGRYEAK